MSSRDEQPLLAWTFALTTAHTDLKNSNKEREKTRIAKAVDPRPQGLLWLFLVITRAERGSQHAPCLNLKRELTSVLY